MKRTVVRVAYMDGTTEDVRIGARARVEAERKFEGQFTSVVERYLFTIWVAAGKPGSHRDEDDRFNAWLDTVDDADPEAADEADAEAEVAAEDPTDPAPGPG